MSGRFTKLILMASLTGWQMGAQDISTFVREANQSYTEVRDNILKGAEWMPEANYNFRPIPASPSFGQIVADVARSQLNVCSAVGGSRVSADFPYAGSKADLIETLRQSIRKCDSAYASVNPYNGGQEVPFGNRRYSKLGLLFLNASHDHELYGRLEVYLRLKGILSPSNQARIVPLD